MKRIIALLALLAATIPAWAQNTTAGKRIVYDETCREEYQKAESATAAPKPEATKSETTSKPVELSAAGEKAGEGYSGPMSSYVRQKDI